MTRNAGAGQVEAEDFSDKAADKAKEVNENVDKAAEKVADKARRCEIIKHKKSTHNIMSAFFMQFIQHLASNLEYALIGRREQYQVQQNLIRSKRSKRLQIWRYTMSPVVRSKQNLPLMTRTTLTSFES